MEPLRMDEGGKRFEGVIEVDKRILSEKLELTRHFMQPSHLRTRGSIRQERREQDEPNLCAGLWNCAPQVHGANLDKRQACIYQVRRFEASGAILCGLQGSTRGP